MFIVYCTFEEIMLKIFCLVDMRILNERFSVNVVQRNDRLT